MSSVKDSVSIQIFYKMHISFTITHVINYVRKQNEANSKDISTNVCESYKVTNERFFTEILLSDQRCQSHIN